MKPIRREQAAAVVMNEESEYFIYLYILIPGTNQICISSRKKNGIETNFFHHFHLLFCCLFRTLRSFDRSNQDPTQNKKRVRRGGGYSKYSDIIIFCPMTTRKGSLFCAGSLFRREGSNEL